MTKEACEAAVRQMQALGRPGEIIDLLTYQARRDRYIGFATDRAIMEALDQAAEAGPAIGHP